MTEQRNGVGYGFLFWCGTGMLSTGLLTAAAGLLLGGGRESGAWSFVLWGLLGVAVAGLLVSAYTSFRKKDGEAAPRTGAVRLWACLALLGAVVLCLVGFPSESFWWTRFGFADSEALLSAVAWAGTAAAALGFLLVLVSGARKARSRRRFLAGLVAGVAAAAVVAAGGAAATVYEEVEHTTHEAAGTPAAVPASAEEVTWVWEAPEGVAVHDVHPVPGGALVDVGDGVIALDTVTGEERWRYRRPGQVARFGVAPDGQTVVLSYFTAERGFQTRRFVLDARSGRLLGEYDVTVGVYQDAGEDGRGEQDLGYLHIQGVETLTSGARVVADSERGALSARDLADNSLLWTREGDPRCVEHSRTALGDLLFQAVTCADELETDSPTERTEYLDSAEAETRVVALDARTGEEVWCRSWRTRSFYPRVFFPGIRRSLVGLLGYQSPEETLLVVESTTGSSGQTSGKILDPQTGEVLADDLGHASGGDGNPVLHATGDSLVVGGEGAASGVEWRSFDGEARRTLALPGPATGAAAGIAFLPGAVAWLSAEEGAVHITPWSEEGEASSVDLRGSLEGRDVTGPLGLLPAPGSLVVYPRSSEQEGEEPEGGVVLGLS